MTPMREVEFYGMKFRVDAEQTRDCYDAAPDAGPEGCGCDDCSNFIRVRDQVYIGPLKEFMALVGLNLPRETETACVDTEEHPGYRLYMNWMHCVGEIPHDFRLGFDLESGRCVLILDDCPIPKLSPLTNDRSNSQAIRHIERTKSIGVYHLWCHFSKEKSVLPKSFSEQPVTQMDFILYAPWVMVRGRTTEAG